MKVIVVYDYKWCEEVEGENKYSVGYILFLVCGVDGFISDVGVIRLVEYGKECISDCVYLNVCYYIKGNVLSYYKWVLEWFDNSNVFVYGYSS